MKNTILITKLNKNENNNNEIANIVNEIINNKKTIELLDRNNLELIKKLLNYNYDTIGLADENIRLTISKPKEIKKINYDETLINIEDKSKYKKEKITMVWNDELIEQEIDNIVYVVEESKTRLTIGVLNKHEQEN